MSSRNKEREKQLNNVLNALRTLCKKEVPHTTVPPQVNWPKTREIAEYCEITIYLARYYLLRLVDEKKAYVTSGALNNSLRWYIAESVPLAKQHSKREELSCSTENLIL
ncbi:MULTISPECIES: FaeA/PapI family transcriptional regulator [unclassified Serratia (in: enterobacteria)]|uniref:FaeA/PapI family transcriptional regulator n=1 Tax=unclassified Serratia (in: enterobacteria) TaxID=2647522 RepID=UPI00068B1516|nr:MULTISPECIES: FaeA/PapI family transcriptional regulator [unclassified Serratia (in: enterobacteria)]